MPAEPEPRSDIPDDVADRVAAILVPAIVAARAETVTQRGERVAS